jgi:hypothetical protein
MELETTFICAHCLQTNTILVDGSGGRHQEYIEDCQVCCYPNRLVIMVDEQMKRAEACAEIA